jgi:hypothetical protein
MRFNRVCNTNNFSPILPALQNRPVSDKIKPHSLVEVLFIVLSMTLLGSSRIVYFELRFALIK